MTARDPGCARCYHLPPSGNDASGRFPHGENRYVTVILTGRDLRRDEVVRVARLGEPVELHDDARARMLATRAVVEERLASPAIRSTG